MHETMVAQNLLATISSEAKKQNARPVSAKVSCGVLNAINDEALCFAFDAITRDTSCEGVRLEIEHKRTQGQCKNCNRSFEIELSDPRCPDCGSDQFDLLPDAPIILEEIEFQSE